MGPAAVAIAVWVVAAAFGASRLAVALPGRFATDRLPEDVQRNAAWSPIYGFADVCQADIAPAARVLLIDPTGAAASVSAAERTGPAAFGLAADLDWPNEATFAYVLHPRPVSAIGHVPPDLAAATGSVEYVAVWRQAAYRTADAAAAATDAEAAVASTRGAALVCAYTGPDGDRGVVYRMAAAVGAAANPAPGPLWGGRAGAYLSVFLGLLGLWIIGFVVVRLTAGSAVSGVFAASASLPLGCLFSSLELIAFSVAGVPWSLPLLAAPWIAAGAALVVRERAAVMDAASSISVLALARSWSQLSPAELVAVVGLVALSLILFAGAPQGLPWSDGFNLYYFKSRAFFDGGSVVPFYHAAASMLYSFPAHPPLVSLAVTWLYLFIGQVDEHTTLLLWPALYVSLAGTLYALVRTRLARVHALWFVLAAALIGYEVSTRALEASYADLPLAVWLLLACGALWLWASERRWRLLVLAGISLGGAAMTKEEGIVAAGVILAVTPLLVGGGRPYMTWSRLQPLAVAAPVFALVAAPWLILRAEYQLPELTVLMGGALSTMVTRMPVALGGLGLRAALPLAPFVALLVVAALSRSWQDLRGLGGRFWFLVAVLVIQLGVDAAAIAATPVEVHHQVAIAATRLVSQVLPLAFLASLDLWLAIAAPARQRAADAETTTTQRKTGVAAQQL